MFIKGYFYHKAMADNVQGYLMFEWALSKPDERQLKSIIVRVLTVKRSAHSNMVEHLV